MKVVNTYSSWPVQPGADARQLAVLTEDDAGKCAVYVGVVKDWANDAQREQRANWVAFNGAKLSLEKARAFYPLLTEESYRR